MTEKEFEEVEFNIRRERDNETEALIEYLKAKLMEERAKTFTKEQYDRMKARADELGVKLLTKWRKGLKSIRTEPIILSEEEGDYGTSN